MTLPQTQPECAWSEPVELVDCGSWAVSAGWDVPATAVSGVYVAHLTRTDTGGQSHITFIVRDDGSTADMVFQTADTTWQAYNTYGGSSFYSGGANQRAYKLSYNRPFNTRGLASGRDFYFSAEYAMVRFLEQNGYDVTYIAGADTHRNGARLLNHKTFLSVGHDEYWSGPQRTAVEQARDAGVNLAFFAGNEMYWRTRWEPSVAGPSTNHRTLVSYKETWSRAKIDPSSEWTGTWRDPRYASTAAGAGRPEGELIGTQYMVNYSDLPLTVTAEEGKLRIWRGTTLTSLPAGTSQALAQHTVGYESNEDLDNGFRPEGLIRMSTTVGDVPEYLQDFGNTVAPGATRHNITMYKAASGALVFSAGTVQWSWGLDQEHDGDGAPADSRMRQATVNLFADMGVQPDTLASGITPATRTTDVTGPTTQIQGPAAQQSFAGGSNVTVTGTASDAAGRVAGVEVSLDGGQTWHPATGRASWTYTGQIFGSGAARDPRPCGRRLREHRGRRVPGRPGDLPVHGVRHHAPGERPGRRLVGGRAGHAVRGGGRRLRQRRPVPQGRGEHRRAPRDAVERGRRAAGRRGLHGRVGDRVAEGVVRPPGARRRGAGLRGVLHRAVRRLHRHVLGVPGPGACRRAAHRPGRVRRRAGRPVRRGRYRTDPVLGQRRLLRGPRVHVHRRLPAGGHRARTGRR